MGRNSFCPIGIRKYVTNVEKTTANATSAIKRGGRLVQSSAMSSPPEKGSDISDEKRNIHFYVNKCGFKIDEFWCEYYQPEHGMPDDDEHDPDEGPDEMFRFVKVMKP